MSGSLTTNKNQGNFDSFSTTTSISLVNYDTTSQASNSLPVLNDQANSVNNFKLTNDDFEFLEKMSTTEKPKKSSKKSSKSSKTVDSDSNDTESKTKSKRKNLKLLKSQMMKS